MPRYEMSHARAALGLDRHAGGGARRRQVLLVDNDALVRRVLADALQAAGYDVVADADNAQAATELAFRHRPDFVIVELLLPDGSGLDLIRRLASTLGDQVRIVVLTRADDSETALAALRAGATGYLTKDVALDRLGQALRAAEAGEPLISRRLVGVLVARLRSATDPKAGRRPVPGPLTPREREVLDLLCLAYTNEAIAAALVLSVETVRSHIKSILRKTGASNRTEAVARAEGLRRPRAVSTRAAA